MLLHKNSHKKLYIFIVSQIVNISNAFILYIRLHVNTRFNLLLLKIISTSVDESHTCTLDKSFPLAFNHFHDNMANVTTCAWEHLQVYSFLFLHERHERNV